MILSESIFIKIHNTCIKYYREKGYLCNVGDMVEIKVSDLPKSSSYKIKVQCDCCPIIKEIPFGKYNKNISKYGIYTCSTKCSKFKNKLTCLELYNNENYNNREKSKETCNVNFGCDNPMKNLGIRNKASETVEIIYGDKILMNNKEIVEKVISYGIMPRKTFITRLPKIPYEFMSHFMRGVLEGDGTITIRSGGYFNRSDYKRLTVDIASGNEQFPIDIISYLGYGKFLPNYGKIGHQSCRASFDCSNAVKFLNWTYQNSDGLRLTRKWNTWQSFLECGQTYK